MGIIQDAGNVWGQGAKARKSKSKLLMSQANARIQAAERARMFREKEDPREQAHNKQTLFARGMGKSTIAEQDTERLSMIQSHRNASIASALHLAVRYKQYLKVMREYERRQAYAALADDVLNTFYGTGSGETAAYGYVGSEPSSTEFSGGGTTDQQPSSTPDQGQGGTTSVYV